MPFQLSILQEADVDDDNNAYVHKIISIISLNECKQPLCGRKNNITTKVLILITIRRERSLRGFGINFRPLPLLCMFSIHKNHRCVYKKRELNIQRSSKNTYRSKRITSLWCIFSTTPTPSRRLFAKGLMNFSSLENLFCECF